MSGLIANKVQLGNDLSNVNNFTWTTNGAGLVQLINGAANLPLLTVLSIDSVGNIFFPGIFSANIAILTSLVTPVGNITTLTANTITATGNITAANFLGNVNINLTGDVTSVPAGANTVVTFNTVNSTVGTFGNTTQIPVVTVNGKGLVTAVSTAAISGNITLIGDATGTGVTGGNTTVTLDTVNSNVGSFGSTTQIPVVTVNGKGLVTAVSTATITGNIALIGDVSGIGQTGANTVTTVNFVGGDTAANVASGANLALAATSANVASTIVKRDTGGNFSANTITSNLIGAATNVVTNATSDNATYYIGAVESASAPGNQAIQYSTGVSINPSTNTLTATTLAGTLSTASQPNVTSVNGTSIPASATLVTTTTLDNATLAASFTTAQTSGNLTVGGNLIVLGNTTTIESQTLTVTDAYITLANVATPTDTTAITGGMVVLGATNKTFQWASATNGWKSSETIDLASGKAYQIADTSVLNATTLGSGVLNSSLTSVGTLAGVAVTGNATVTGNVVVSSGNFYGPAAGITGTATGFTAGNVTNIPNLTGVITSVGSATSWVNPNGTGNVILNISPTLTTPNLGTPSTLVGTNITGTATGFTANVANYNVVAAKSDNVTYYPTFVNATSGSLADYASSGLSFNPSTNTLTATTFVGALTGSISGSAPTLTTARNIYGESFNGSADLSGIIASTYGGTGNGFAKLSGPASSEKTFTLPNASDTIACLGQVQNFTKSQSASVTALSVSSNAIAIDFSSSNNFSVTLQATSSQQLSNPTNAVAGTSGQIAITQNATASPLTFASNWISILSAPAVSVVAGSVTLLTYYVVDSTHIWFGLSTVNGVNSGSTMVYPASGIPNSTGSAWSTSYSTTGSGTVLALATSPTFVTPLLGTPTSGVLTNCTGTATGLTAGIATNLAGTTAYQIPYQSASATTSYVAAGATSQVLTATGSAAPSWAYPVISQTQALSAVTTGTLSLTDGGGHIYITDTAFTTFTIPAASSVAFPIGTSITIVNAQGTTAISIAITTDTMYLANAGTTGTRTLAKWGVATILKVAGVSSSGVWIISGVGVT